MSDATKAVFVLAAMLACLCAGIVLCATVAPAPRPLDDTLPSTKLDLSDVFAENPNVAERREHAKALAEVMAIVADGVEWDGEQPGAERLFTTGANVDDHIVRVRKFFTQRWTFAKKYPQLGTTLGDYLKQRLGKDLSDSLTEERREDWIQALREVQASALQI